MKDTVMSLLHKNGVITGLVESYCLPCEVHLGTKEVARAHIADVTHWEKLDSAHYLDTHKDDGIRKMPQGYYCEYCNKLFCTTINVKLHVAEGEHQRNKDSQWLREQGDVVVVRNQLVVDSDSWHGLVDGACALCNTEYLDKDAHKTIATHLLKLIQSNVELHASGSIYRKGNDFFHCLICNAVFSLKSFGTHFEQTDHVQLYNECCETFKNITAHVNINGKLASKVNIQIERDDENTADIGEISDLKSIENKQTFEIETNMTIKTQEPSFLLQTTTGEETSYEYNGESMLKKDCPKDEEISGLQLTNNEHVSETETNKDNKIHSEIIVTEDFQIQQQTETLHETVQESIPNKDTDNDTFNYKHILHQATNNKQMSEGETNKVYKNYCEVIITTPEMFYTLQTNEIVMKDFQTQHKTDTFLEVTEESIPKTESKYDTLNCEDILKHEEFQTQQYTETPQETTQEIIPEKKTESDILNDKDINEQQSTSNEFVSEIAENTVEHQTTETLQEVIKDWLPNNDGEIESVNDKDILEQKLSDNEDTFENSAIKSNENNFPATTEQNFETTQSTEDLIQKVERMPISKKEKAKIIANENKIRYKEGYTRAFCSICLTNISSALKSIERHVISVTHKYEARRIFRFVSDVMPLHEFVEELKLIELELTTYAVINNRYCIDLSSYLLMTRYHSYIRCNICELNFNVSLFDDHQLSETHNGALANIPVVLSHPSEFIREVQPGYYHCGFCNSYEGSWRGLRDHCKSLTHLQQKLINSKKLKLILSH